MENRQPREEMTVSELFGLILYCGSVIGAIWLILWLLGADKFLLQ
jgi:hypothetical protein